MALDILLRSDSDAVFEGPWQLYNESDDVHLNIENHIEI